MNKTFGIALVGCGVVGGGTAKILVQDRSALKDRTGLDLELKYIVDVKFDHAKRLGLSESLFTSDLDKVLADPGVDAVIELIGGTGYARTVAQKVLGAKKHLVTANKALLAGHGAELFDLARKSGVAIGFEASCVGGVPVIKVLTEDLAANRIEALYGIVNGTTNYILTAMLDQNKGYQQALGEAQSLGFAEADPTLDVSGMDSAHKLTIMASLAFSTHVETSQIEVIGIQDLSLADVDLAKTLGFAPKLIASATRQGKDLALSVRPTLLPLDHPLASIKGSFNALSVYGNWLGHSLYFGRGAGASPTASAVVADLVGLAVGNLPRIFAQYKFWPDLTQKAQVLPSSEVTSSWYIRLSWDEGKAAGAGVLGVLEKSGLKVQKAAVAQTDGHTAWVVITEPATAGLVQSAMKALESLEGSLPEKSLLPILYLRPENLG